MRGWQRARRLIGAAAYSLQDGVCTETVLDIARDDYGAIIPNAALCLASGLSFRELYFGPRGDTIIGFNRAARKVLKIGLRSHPRKLQDVAGEAVMLRDLMSKGCSSCPEVLEAGTLELGGLCGILRQQLFDPLDCSSTLPYFVMTYIDSLGTMPLADLLLALLEQKNLGYYHGDIKPGNIRFDAEKGICVLVDYDQACKLDCETISFNAEEFFRWCDAQEMRKYGMATWRRHFQSISDRQLGGLLRDGALDLAQTTLFKRQRTTNSASGIYHSIKHRDVFADGARDLRDRLAILDAIDFAAGERILDIGCNAGLLCHYLYDRGCAVTGAELDSYMVEAAGIIARITGRDLKFLRFDLDEDQIPGYFDTIMLFSVLHHSSDVVEASRKIAVACNRIIVECRAVESGKRTDRRVWRRSSQWDYGDSDGLIRGLERLFPGFNLKANHGVGDKNRYVLELVRKDSSQRASRRQSN